MDVKQLSITAAKARLLGLSMVYQAASGHLGGSFSSMDVLTLLYNGVMHIDPANPHDPDRDRFVLSKGHCTPALYPVLSLRGYFPQEDLQQFRSIDGHMSGHAEMSINGVDMSTGSLGQGISAAVGMALAGKMDRKAYRVYTLLGDGELAEGQVWEAAMAAAKFQLDNLCVIVDVNGLQIDGKTADVMPTEPLDQKFAAFGFHVVKVADGHDYAALQAAFDEAASTKGKPTVLLLRTTKGKGVSFMENNAGWHGKAPGEEQYQQARAELEAALSKLEVE